MLHMRRRLTVAAAQRVCYRAEGARALAAEPGPVLTVDLLRSAPADLEPGGAERATTWANRYDTHLHQCSTRIATLRPSTNAASVLLGDPVKHTYDRIIVAEHPNGEAACNTLFADQLIGPKVVGAGSLTLWARRAERFGGVGAFTGETAPLLRAERRSWSDCPFAQEASPWQAAQPDAWQQVRCRLTHREYPRQLPVIANTFPTNMAA